jgi:Family of unknown function (DUF6279)
MRFFRQKWLKKRAERAVRPFFAALFAAAIVVLLNACSAIGLAYNNADTFLLSRLDSYLDLDSRQEAFARERVGNFFAWHRRQELPDYARWLRALKPRVAQGLTEADVAKLAGELNQKSDRALMRLAPELAELALTFGPEQITRLKEKYAESVQEMRKDYVDAAPEKQLNKRFEDLLSTVERLYGSFSSEQKAQLKTLSDTRPLNHNFLLAERIRRQQETLGVLEKIRNARPGLENATRDMTQLFERFSPSPDAQRRAYFDQLNQTGYAAVALASNIATEEQRKLAQQRLEGWARDLDTLAVKK